MDEYMELYHMIKQCSYQYGIGTWKGKHSYMMLNDAFTQEHKYFSNGQRLSYSA